MKWLLLLVLPALLLGQRALPNKPAVMAPAVIVLVPSADKATAMLLVTKELPANTNVLPVVTVNRHRSILPSFQITGPGLYPLPAGPIGAEFMVYLTPPTGDMLKIQSTSILRGYQYDGGTLSVYGAFTDGEALVYLGTSPAPVRPSVRNGHLELSLRPTGAVTTVTVYKAGGICDSIVVRLGDSKR